jgi:hypothetical protein
LARIDLNYQVIVQNLNEEKDMREVWTYVTTNWATVRPWLGKGTMIALAVWGALHLPKLFVVLAAAALIVGYWPKAK